MKIGLLVPGGVDRGGTVRVLPWLLWLIERLVAEGHEVHVFAARQQDQPGTWRLLGATVRNIGRRPAALWMTRAIAAEHRRARFDVLHAFWSQLGLVGAIAGKLLRIPLVLTLPGGDVVGLRDIGYGLQLSRRGRWELRIAARCAAQVNTPSRFMRNLAARVGIQAAAMPLGVDLVRWPPACPRPRSASTPLKLLHVASLNRVKDQPTLFEALCCLRADVEEWGLAIIGCDTLDGEIHRLATRLGLAAQVRFLGELTHADLRPWFEWADLLVMASRHEAGPMVALEAAVAGVPTAGTRVGHIADLSPDAAVSVPVNDPAALARAIASLAADEAQRLRLARAAQAVAVSKDADFTAQAFLQTYRRVRAC
jgi:glycosyltransferase involved in cell wall biosynthesis